VDSDYLKDFRSKEAISLHFMMLDAFDKSVDGTLTHDTVGKYPVEKRVASLEQQVAGLIANTATIATSTAEALDGTARFAQAIYDNAVQVNSELDDLAAFDEQQNAFDIVQQWVDRTQATLDALIGAKEAADAAAEYIEGVGEFAEAIPVVGGIISGVITEVHAAVDTGLSATEDIVAFARILKKGIKKVQTAMKAVKSVMKKINKWKHDTSKLKAIGVDVTALEAETGYLDHIMPEVLHNLQGFIEDIQQTDKKVQLGVPTYTVYLRNLTPIDVKQYLTDYRRYFGWALDRHIFPVHALLEVSYPIEIVGTSIKMVKYFISVGDLKTNAQWAVDWVTGRLGVDFKGGDFCLNKSLFYAEKHEGTFNHSTGVWVSSSIEDMVRREILPTTRIKVPSDHWTDGEVHINWSAYESYLRAMIQQIRNKPGYKKYCPLTANCQHEVAHHIAVLEGHHGGNTDMIIELHPDGGMTAHSRETVATIVQRMRGRFLHEENDPNGFAQPPGISHGSHLGHHIQWNNWPDISRLPQIVNPTDMSAYGLANYTGASLTIQDIHDNFVTRGTGGTYDATLAVLDDIEAAARANGTWDRFIMDVIEPSPQASERKAELIKLGGFEDHTSVKFRFVQARYRPTSTGVADQYLI
jgi:hypothetical protein